MPAEQRLGGVGVELNSQPCGGIAAPIETKTTNTDGLALFTNPLTLRRPRAAPPRQSARLRQNRDRVACRPMSAPANLERGGHAEE